MLGGEPRVPPGDDELTLDILIDRHSIECSAAR